MEISSQVPNERVFSDVTLPSVNYLSHSRERFLLNIHILPSVNGETFSIVLQVEKIVAIRTCKLNQVGSRQTLSVDNSNW